MLLNLQWAFTDTTGSQKFKWDELIVSDTEAKTILKEAIRFWDREETFIDIGAEFPNLIKSHVKTFGFDSTIPAICQQHCKNYLNYLGFPMLYDIKIGNYSVIELVEAKEENMSIEYWDNNDTDDIDEPLIIDEPILNEFVENLITNVNNNV